MRLLDERGEPLRLDWNHLGYRDLVTGIVMSEWIMCVIGGTSGEGKEGGRVLNARRSGGRMLQGDQQRNVPS